MKSKAVSSGGITVTLSTIFMLLASIIPTATIALVALSGCVLVYPILISGRKLATVVYIVTAIIAALLVPDKTVVVAFIILFGPYTIMKSLLESKRMKLLHEWIIKIIYCNVVTSIYLLIIFLFFDLQKVEIDIIIVYYLLVNAAFVVFDIAFTRLISYIIQRFYKLF